MNNRKEKLKSLLGQGFTSNQIKLIGLDGDEEVLTICVITTYMKVS